MKLKDALKDALVLTDEQFEVEIEKLISLGYMKRSGFDDHGEELFSLTPEGQEWVDSSFGRDPNYRRKH